MKLGLRCPGLAGLAGVRRGCLPAGCGLAAAMISNIPRGLVGFCIPKA